MNIRLLIVGAAIGALGVGGAQAHARHHHHYRGAHSYAAPAQPIPYAQLNLYLRGDRRAAVQPVSYVDMGVATDTAAADEDRNWAASPPPAKPRPRLSEVQNPIGMASPGSSALDMPTKTLPH